MKRKAISLILAMLIILASFPLTAFAADEVTITKVDLTATKALIEGYNCHIEYDGETGEAFNYYYLNDTMPDMTLTFSDGSTKDITFDEYWDYFENPMWCEQGAGDKELKAGTHTKKVYIDCISNGTTEEDLYVEADYTFTIDENPVKSVSVVGQKPLVEEISGSWEEAYGDDDIVIGEYFNYNISETEYIATITYKDGTTFTGTDSELCDATGYGIGLSYDQYNDPFKVGENTIKASFLGVEGDFTFTIIPDPVKSITVTATEELEEKKDGYWDAVDYDDESKGEWFWYDLSETKPTITVEYNDGRDAVTCSYDACYDTFGEGLDFECGQSGTNQLVPGTYTGKAKLLGHECDFVFKIAENPVKSISAKATKDLVENDDCWLIGEDNGEPYLWYVVDATYPEVTVTYTDGTVKTYTYQQMCDLDGDFSIYFEQSAENPLKPGTHTATIKYSGRECEFTFKLIEDPIKSITIKPTRDLIEYTDGYFSEYAGREVFYYDLSRLEPEITITYKDGTVKTYDYASLYRYTEYAIHYDVDQTETQLKAGENTVKALLNNREVDIKFNIVKQNSSQKVKSLVVTAEQNIIEKANGWWTEEYNEATGKTDAYYYYTPYNITYTATVTFEDGTTKTYRNLDAYENVDGSDFDVWFNQSYSNQYKVGKNTATAYYRNAKCDFQFEIVENNYTAVSISGDNELVVTLTKADGTKENYKAKSFEAHYGGDNMRGGQLVTDSRVFDVEFALTVSEDETSFENIQLSIFENEKKLQSNVLKSNEWLDMITFAGEIDLSAAVYADGYSKRFYNREFTGLSGDFTGAKVDDILTICTCDADYEEYKDTGIDEKGYYAILTLEEAEDLVNDYFDASKIDFTSSPMYNAGPKEIKVYFIRWGEGETKNELLEYKNDKFVYSADYISNYTGATYPVTVVLNANGFVESVSFTKGVCGNVKTINAKNAEGGVNVTFTAAENATEYEIYRDYNNKGYEKIGTTTELSYLDKTAVSGMTYTYKVLPKNPTSQGAMSAGKTVTYLAMPVTTATISKTGFTVKWTKVDGAATYRVYRAEYANGKWSNWEVLSDQKASVSALADKTVKAGGVYKYTVRALNSDGISGYKGTETIVYLTTPTVKIANASAGVKGTFSQVEGATGYIVYRAEYDSSTKKWSSWTNLGTAKATAKSFTDKTAVSGKTYRYTVRAVNGDSKSLYTASNTLLYLAEPAVTIQNAKAGITVKWTKSAGVTGFTVYRSEYNASTNKWSSWKNMGTAKAEKSSWTDKNVKAGITYKYTVRAVNGNIKSTYTATAGLVRLNEPTVSIANAKTGITVKWSKVSGATGYTVYRSTLVDGKWTSWKNMGTAKAEKSSWTDKSVASGTTYKYTVRAVNGTSLSSYTATLGLMFLGEPTVKIANAATGVKVSWSKVEGATGYTVYRSEYNASTKKWSKWASRGTAASDKTSWTDKKVTSGVQYKYTVRAVNGNFKSTYTATSALLYLARPTVTATKATSGVAVSWTKSAGATSYIVYRQEMVDGAWSKWSTLGTAKASANSFADKTAESGKEYRYTVRAVNGKVKSAYTASNTVKG